MNNNAWQNQARNTSGEFGHRIHPESDTVIPAAPAATGTVTAERCNEIRDRAIDAAETLSNERDKMTHRMNGAALTAAAAAVRAKFPNAARLTASDDYEGAVHWTAADTDGNEIYIHDDDELSDDLYRYSNMLTMERPSLMEDYAATGPGGAAAFEIGESVTGYRVEEIEVDIDELLTAAPNH